MPKEIVIPYFPHEYQLQIHEAMARFTVIVAHRRFGKTYLSVNQLVRGVLSIDTIKYPMPRFAYIAPTNKQAVDIAWEYLKMFTRVIPGCKSNETNHHIQFPNGGRITVYGAENSDNLRGMYLDGAVLDEVALMKESVWGSVIRPLLADRKGWTMFIGTPMGKNLFYKLYKQGMDDEYTDWKSFLYTVEDTDVLDRDEVNAARKIMSIDEFAQEFLCSFEASIKGAYYANILSQLDEEGRMGGFPWIPEYPVYTAWDLGYKDDTAIWFYQKPPGGFPRIIDYYESNQKGMLQYANTINQKPYFYGGHFAPHDVNKHELGSGKTTWELANNFGLQFKVVKKIPIQDGINYVRMFLPRCYFNTDNANVDQGVDHLRSYRRDYDERLSVFRKKPLHNAASHGADGFRYLAISYEDSDPSLMGHKVPASHLVDHYKRVRPLSREKQSVFDLPQHRGNIIRGIR